MQSYQRVLAQMNSSAHSSIDYLLFGTKEWYVVSSIGLQAYDNNAICQSSFFVYCFELTDPFSFSPKSVMMIAILSAWFKKELSTVLEDITLDNFSKK